MSVYEKYEKKYGKRKQNVTADNVSGSSVFKKYEEKYGKRESDTQTGTVQASLKSVDAAKKEEQTKASMIDILMDAQRQNALENRLVNSGMKVGTYSPLPASQQKQNSDALIAGRLADGSTALTALKNSREPQKQTILQQAKNLPAGAGGVITNNTKQYVEGDIRGKHTDAKGNVSYSIPVKDVDVSPYEKKKADEIRARENARMIAEETAKARVSAEKNPLLGEVQNVATRFAGSIMTPLGVIAGRTDPNDPMYAKEREAQAYNQGVKTGVKNKLGVEDGTFASGAVDFGVDTLTSMIETGLRAAVGGGIGSVVGGAAGATAETARKIASAVGSTQASLSAFSSGYVSAKDKGVDNGTAIMNATAQGIAEWFFERFSIDRLLKDTPIYSFKDAVKEIGKNMLTEGSEEFATDIANAITDRIIMGKDSDFSIAKASYIRSGMTEADATKYAVLDVLKQASLSFLGGAISGGMLGSGKSVGRAFFADRAANNSTMTAEQMRETADAIDPSTLIMENGMVDTEAAAKLEAERTFLNESANKLESGKALTNAEKARAELGVTDVVSNSKAVTARGIEDRAEQFPAKAAETYKRNYDNTDIVTYDENMKSAYLLGAKGESLESLEGNEGFMKFFGSHADAVTEMWQEGVNDYTERVKAENVVSSKNFVYTEKQKNGLSFIGKTTGYKFTAQVSRDPNMNAKVDLGSKTIYFNPNSEQAGDDIIHELGHITKSIAQVEFKEVQDSIVGFLARQKGYSDATTFLDDAMADYRKTYEKQLGRKLTDDEVIEEIVCDAMPAVFSDEKELKRLAKENRTFVQKVLDFLNEMIEALTSFNVTGDANRVSREIKAHATVEELTDMRRKALNALNAVNKNAGALNDITSNTSSNEEAKGIVETSGTMHSFKVDDRNTLDFLNEQKKTGNVIHTYKAMQLVDGELHSPMAAKVKGEDGKYGGNWFTTSRKDADSYAGNYKHLLYDPNEKDVKYESASGDYRLADMRFDTEKDREEFMKKYPNAEEIYEDRYDEYYYDYGRMHNDYVKYELEHSRIATIGEIFEHPEDFERNDIVRAWDAYDSNNAVEDDDDVETLIEALRYANEETKEDNGDDIGIEDISFKARIPIGKSGIIVNRANNRTYETYINISSPYEFDNNGQPMSSNSAYRRVENALKSDEYDGVIIRNVKVGAYQDNGIVAIIKDSNQAKLTSNENPTENEDIRYSLNVEESKSVFNADRVKAAKKEYGVTTDFREAGYLLPDGYMLDFSGKKEGGPSHVRYMDHREISRVFNEGEVDTKYYETTPYMVKFISEGNIRLMDGQGVTIGEIEPTAKQYAVLKRFIDYVIDNEDFFYLDFSNSEGNTVESREYSESDNATRVIKDIKEYFKSGELPYRSDLQQYRYSLNVDDYIEKGTAAYAEAEKEAVREDLRNKMGIDEVSNGLFLTSAYKELQEANNAIGDLLSKAKFIPAETNIRNRAKKLIESVNSSRSVDEVAEKLSALYEYIYNADQVDGELVSTAASDLAEWIVEARGETETEYSKERRAAIRKVLKGQTIHITPDLLDTYDWLGGGKALRKFFGTVTFSKKSGMDVDVVYQELNEMAPDIFPMDDETGEYNLWNKADQLRKIVDVLSEPREYETDNLSEEDYGTMAYELGQTIFDDYFKTKFVAEDKQMQRLYEMYKNSINRFKESQKREMAKYKERYNDRLKASRQMARDRYTKFRERENSKAAKKAIIRNALSLTRMLEQPTNSKHIPEAFRKPLASFLQNIDFSSEDFFRTGNVTKRTNDWLAMQNALAAELNRTDDANTPYFNIDPDLVAKMEGIRDSLKTVARIEDMPRTELFELRDTLVAIKKCIETADEMIASRQKRKVSDVGNGTISDLSKLESSGTYKGFFGTASNLLANEMLDAETRFHTFGNHAEEVLEELRDGFNKKIRCVADAADYIGKLKEELGVTDKDIKEWESTEIRTGGVSLRTDYVMSLYELMKRKQAKDHILKGGVTPVEYDDLSTKINKITKKQKGGSIIHLTEAMVMDITSRLTEKQIKFADGVAKYFATVAEWGNEATMTAYGYRKFTEENHFPIRTDSNYRDTRTKDFMSDGMNAIKSMGFTKNVVKGATNPIYIEGILDVFTNHIEQMSSYAGFLNALDDVQKWYNYRPTIETEDGYHLRSDVNVKTEIKNTYGEGAQKYVEKLLKDINGTTQNEKYPFKGLVTAFKGSAVGANLSVAIQQPTSYIRAMAVLEPKYLIKAFGKKSSVSLDTIKKYSPIAQWKDWGFYDVNVGRSMKYILTGATTLKEDLRDKQMWLAGKGDEITWKQLWSACEEKVKDTTKLEVGSDSFYKKVAEVFDDVIDRTQVVDTVFHRTDVMRNKNAATQATVSFMSEPMKSYNMLYRAAFDAATKKDKESKGKLGMAALAFLMSNAGAAAAKSLITAMRKSGAGRDKEYWDRWNEAFIEEVLGNIRPSNYIPFVRDIVSIFEGYSVDRTDLAAAKSFYYAVNKWKKFISGESTETFGSLVLYTTKAISDLTGIALYGAQRDVNALIDTTFEALGLDVAEYEKYRLFGKSIKNKSNAKDYVGLAIRAYTKDNNALGDKIIRDMLNSGIEQKTIDEKMVDALKANDQVREILMNNDSTRGVAAKAEAKVLTADESKKTDIVDKIIASGKSGKDKVDMYKALYPDDFESDKYTAWKKSGGTDFDYIKYKNDMAKLGKQESIVRYIKNQTSDVAKQKTLWNLAGYVESTFEKNMAK